jgi:alpha-ketoglutarate-dependent taurine dioxygenase
MSVLSQVLQPLHVRTGDEPDADVVVLRRSPTPDEVAEILDHPHPVVCAHSPAVLAPFAIACSDLPPRPSRDPLVADPVHEVEAEDLRFPLSGGFGIDVDEVLATAEGMPVAGRVGRLIVLAGRWEDVAADDQGALFWTRKVLGYTDPAAEQSVLDVLTKPGPEVEHPPVAVIDGSGWSVPEVPDVEINSGEFLRAVAHAGRTLPAALYDALVDFVDDAPASGALLVENMPLGDVPPTPEEPLAAAKPDKVSEFALLTVGRVLGRPVGYLPEHGGDVVQNISPTKRNADRQVSTSSKSMLEFHTEAAFHPHRPRYLLLLCLRGDPAAATTLCSISAVLDTLSPRSRAVLFQPRFTTGIDESYAGGRSAARSVQRPVLSGDPDAPKLWLDADLMTGTDPVAQEALDELARLVREHATGVTLKAGDLLVVDNDIAVHGRTPFTPRFDGTDRWLQRTFVIADHTAADGSRDGRVITTRFIA